MCTTREVILFSAFLTEGLRSLASSGESLGLFLFAAGTRIMEPIVLSVENMEGGQCLTMSYQIISVLFSHDRMARK